MSMHDERYVLTILKGGAVVLHDAETGEIHRFGDTSRALFNALGVLADWRERDADGRPRKAVCVHPYASVDGAGQCRDCGSSLTITVTPSCPYDCGHRDCPVHGPEDEARDKAGYGVTLTPYQKSHLAHGEIVPTCGYCVGELTMPTRPTPSGACTCGFGPEGAHFPDCPQWRPEDGPICTPERRLDHGHTIACGPMGKSTVTPHYGASEATDE